MDRQMLNIIISSVSMFPFILKKGHTYFLRKIIKTATISILKRKKMNRVETNLGLLLV